MPLQNAEHFLFALDQTLREAREKCFDELRVMVLDNDQQQTSRPRR